MRDNIRAFPTAAPNDVARRAGEELNRLLDEVNQIAYMALGSAALQIGTGSTAAVRINATTPFLHAGEFKSKAAAEIAFTADDHDIAADADAVQEAVYVVSLDADGAITLTMGEIATGAGEAEVPDAPEDETVVGHVRVAVDAGATDFDAGSDALSAGHLTVAYTNVAFLLPGAHARKLLAMR